MLQVTHKNYHEYAALALSDVTMNIVVLENGQNFIVDLRFCKTDWSSTNDRLVEMFLFLFKPSSRF